MSDLISRLQSALGATYRIDRELGGGGMSRVFLAEETELARMVVIKVLPPEMAAGVSAERFQREIKLAASLQHPHIVPLLTAGTASTETGGASDLLYYVMPFIEGESLRAKLAREGELPVAETVRILKEVLDALQHAHSHGVVHRDIKPDNVLLSGSHAVVTDFGVAKAVSASTGESSLTSLGVALGTPAYMAPEQAAADPHVDHRADIYAVGALAYEMLTARPPFTGANPQAVLSAHITQAPDPVITHRDTVPQALNELIMRCLAKKAADRWQRADEMMPHLDAMLTPTGGLTPVGTQPVAAVTAESGTPHLLRVGGMFGLAAVAVLGAAYGLMIGLGLPDWVFLGAVLLMAIGLPIILATGHHERRRDLAAATGTQVTTGAGLVRHFTWSKSVRGGVMAFAALTVVAVAYMVSRGLGIGPAGTLVAAGVLDERDRLILSDFTNVTDDSTLAESVTELVRVDLSQSPTIDLVEPSQIATVLRRMERPANEPLTLELATEIAQREGHKGVVTGEVRSVGSGYVITMNLLAANTGDVLLAERVTAGGADDIVNAIDALSGKLRERIGESLRTIRADPPLERVTTRSMTALRKYGASELPFNLQDYGRAAALLREAIAEDSTFAMAYRRLGVVMNNMGADRDSAHAMLTHAYELRDRLTERERYHAEGIYHWLVTQDREQATAVYRTLLDKYPNDRTALNNLSIHYVNEDRWEDAEALLMRSIGNGNAPGLTYGQAVHTLGHLDKLDEARLLLAEFAERYPGNPQIRTYSIDFATSEFDYDAAEALIDSLEVEQRGNDRWNNTIRFRRAGIARIRGRLRFASRILSEIERPEPDPTLHPDTARLNAIDDTLHMVMDSVIIDLDHRLDPDRAVARMDGFLQRYGMTALRPEDRHYLALAEYFARAGLVDRAIAMRDAWRADSAIEHDDANTEWTDGVIAYASGRHAEAIEGLRRLEQDDDCPICQSVPLGLVYEAAGKVDSAIVEFEKYVTTPWMHRAGPDQQLLATALRRLGPLCEQQGDAAKAIEYYDRFIRLWEEADEDLQPQVEEARRRLAGLVSEGR